MFENGRRGESFDLDWGRNGNRSAESSGGSLKGSKAGDDPTGAIKKSPPSTHARQELRSWQLDAFTQWARTRRGVASVVTGAGKTRLALECVNEFLGWTITGKVIVVVPTIALADQWHVEIAEFFSRDLNTVCRHSGRRLPKDCEMKQFHVATINTARTNNSELSSHGRWMLVVDECHRAGSLENRKCMDGRWEASIGLSATPVREYDDYYQMCVEPRLGSIIAEYDYKQALTDGVLTRFRLLNVRIPMRDDEVEAIAASNKRIARLMNSDSHDPEAIRQALRKRAQISQSLTYRAPVAAKLAENVGHDGILVFHERIGEAERILRRLVSAGVRARTYHSQMSIQTRLLNLRLFREGQLDVLVTCRALDEGVDIPGASVGIIAAGTASRRQRIQRLGRVLRRAPGKEWAEVYSLYALDTERQRLQEEADGLEGVAETAWLEVRL